ncbi:MAG: DegQ family serine endoprotease [Verrucomicrobiales bacterium]|nr:DegQ family serine endoprotease [Verrucomicrobiales bacterium]
MNTNRPPRLNRGARLALLGAVLLTAAASAVFTHQATAKDGARAADLKLKVDAQPLKREAQLRTSFAPVVKETSHSVVNIFTSTKPRRMEGMPFGGNPMFREFFGDAFRGPGMVMPRQNGLGSGVIVTEDGYILTNNHVVDGADEIKVALNPDGREYDAKVVGRDPKSDIAVLKVEATGLAAIKVANSDEVEVGDVVLAIGNPFGVGQTVTMGIVGGLGRAVPGDAGALEYEDFIQTDAAINPGNSGGALIDVEGRLVGINTAIVSRGGGNNGVGFAVPVNLARNVMESLVEHGRVVRGFLGVNIQNVTPSLASEFGLKEPTGALVTEVSPKGPADKAGLKSGDVVTRFDGRDVRDSRHLKVMVGQTAPNREVRVELLRDGKKREMTIPLRERSGDQELAGRRSGRSPLDGDVGGLQGVVVGDVTDALRQRFDIPENIEGALVTQIDPDSRAADSGLRQGDVIREINRQPVTSAEDAIDAVQKLENARILLKLWRQGGTIFVVVDESRGK